jgi:hypothetical protein
MTWDYEVAQSSHISQAKKKKISCGHFSITRELVVEGHSINLTCQQ